MSSAKAETKARSTVGLMHKPTRPRQSFGCFVLARKHVFGIVGSATSEEVVIVSETCIRNGHAEGLFEVIHLGACPIHYAAKGLV